MKLKFYVLVSYNRASFRKCIYHLPKEHTRIVINTRDRGMRQALVEVCNELGFKYHVTESDGTPATGKNSMLDIFERMPEEYAVMIDGDDFITPYGVQYYTELAHQEKVPDLVCLYKQASLAIINPEAFTVDTTASNIWTYGLEYTADKSDPQMHNMTQEYMKKFFLYVGKTEEEAERWSKLRWEYNQFMNTYSDSYEYMLRMVFFSKHAASLFRYNPVLTIGEDTIQWLQLKRMAIVENKLSMAKKNDKDRPTYIMNREEDGICNQKHKLNWDWMIPLLEEASKIELPPPNSTLPEINFLTSD